jgi:hypothetical protein
MDVVMDLVEVKCWVVTFNSKKLCYRVKISFDQKFCLD